jgi:hypothetical protein
MGPGCIGDDDPVFVLWDDAGKVAIFLALCVVVHFYDCAHPTELIVKIFNYSLVAQLLITKRK